LAIGYVTIPEDWTEDNYQLVETLDSTENEHNTAWNDTLAKLNTHTEICTDFDQYAIVPPSKGGRQENIGWGLFQLLYCSTIILSAVIINICAQ
jgi:hypothetical protein